MGALEPGPGGDGFAERGAVSGLGVKLAVVRCEYG